MPTNTTTYSFQKPVVGADEDDWGGYLNSNWDKVDDLFDGTSAITGIDINSGTIDGTVIGGSSAAAITGTTITGTSFVSSGDMTFGDNNKAIFGAGSDLQIYHDGTHSRVNNNTGDLFLQSPTVVRITNSTASETAAKFFENGAVELYHDNSRKLYTTATGVDITGTLTSDGLTVDKGSAGTLATFTDGVNSNFVVETASLITTVGNTGGSTALAFKSANTERMRIDSSGNLLVGTTSTGGGKCVIENTSANQLVLSNKDTGASAQYACYFLRNNSIVGSIQTTNTATSYITSSDYRLKEDVQPMTGASDRVLALNPVNFAWKADGTRVDGFLAHEAQTVVPEAVTGVKDAMRTQDVYDEDGNVTGTEEVPDYQGIDQSKLVPLLTAALQEALQEITDLKARVTALEAV